MKKNLNYFYFQKIKQIKKYNNSDLYALSVGFIGDKIKYNNHDFFKRWDATEKFTKSEIMDLQKKLSTKYDVGGIEGLIGYKTRRAIGIYQKDNNLSQTCWLPL